MYSSRTCFAFVSCFAKGHIKAHVLFRDKIGHCGQSQSLCPGSCVTLIVESVL